MNVVDGNLNTLSMSASSNGTEGHNQLYEVKISCITFYSLKKSFVRQQIVMLYCRENTSKFILTEILQSNF